MQRRTPETVETAPETAPAGGRVDQVDEQPAPPAPPALPPVAPALLPHLAKVMDAHGDWALTIPMPGRHPEALTLAKIKAATGLAGKQTLVDIRGALLSLCAFPEAAEAYVRERVPEPAAA